MIFLGSNAQGMSDEKIGEINCKHFLETGIYYDRAYDLTSKLQSFENEVIKIEVTMGEKWQRTYNATAYELAYCWKNSHKEFEKAIAAKISLIDKKKRKPWFDGNIANPLDYDSKKSVIFHEYYMN